MSANRQLALWCCARLPMTIEAMRADRFARLCIVMRGGAVPVDDVMGVSGVTGPPGLRPKAPELRQLRRLPLDNDGFEASVAGGVIAGVGEGAEVDLFEALKKEFPDDDIVRVAKGAAGADIIHKVMHNRKECGTIVYDSKNHLVFRNDHVTKLRSDQLAQRAEHAILSLRKFPATKSQLCTRLG
jgi:Uncharacterized protein conserved in bacteria (DUF2130)